MNFMEGMTGIFAIILSLGIPVIAIIMVCWAWMHKKSKDMKIRQLIIENHTDPESIKLLLDEPKKNKKTSRLLTWGCLLLGAGFGALVNFTLNIDEDNDYFPFIIAAGIGIGLLSAFIISWKMEKKQTPTPDEES